MPDVGLTVGGWFASAVISRLIAMAFSYIEDQYGRHTGMKSRLTSLQDKLSQIQAVVESVENGHIKGGRPNLESWLQRLRDAVYEADDVLDEIDYLRLEEKVETGQGKVRAALYLSVKGVTKFSQHAIRCEPIFKKLNKVVKRLDEVASGVGDFLTLVATQPHLQIRGESGDRETGSSLPKITILGREKEIKEIVGWLTEPLSDQAESSSAGNVSLYSVLGMGGVGKTTLARLVYNDERVEKGFDRRMWVCVSNLFDVTVLTRTMLESVTEKKPDVEALDTLQVKLKKELKSKKFLLILDDVWEDGNLPKWEKLLAPLNDGKKGSKILITTRLKSVCEMAAKAMGEREMFLDLKGLEGNDFVSLFNDSAFPAGVEPDVVRGLQPIGNQIAAKLHGSPLAAKTMAGLLSTRLDKKYWTTILHSSIWSLKQSENDIVPVLRLSYDHLPAYLRSCFSYCSIFPKDHMFDKDDLVRMWMAAGLIQPSQYEEKEELEDIGGNYFDDLVWKSFFDPHLSNNSSIKKYMIHDLLHDLAQSTSAGECFRAVGDEPRKIPQTVRHLSVETDNLDVLEEVCQLKHLRTLHLFCSRSDAKFYKVFKELLKALKSIRVMRLEGYFKRGLPHELGNLIHLRYLDLGNLIVQSSFLIWLPESLRQLYHLQTLVSDSHRMGILACLPKRVGNLTCLRYTEAKLHVLPRAGCMIGELKDMDELRGSLKVTGLEHVKDDKEAKEARLNRKQYLNELTLEWDEYRGIRGSIHRSDEKVLNGLQPHSNIKVLRIFNYTGFRSAFWMEPNCMSNLEFIELSGCLRWEQLPPLEKLPLLKHLSLKEMLAVKQIGEGGGFPSLEVLHISILPNWESWAGPADSDQWFPHLRELTIISCPMLESWAGPADSDQWFPHLRELTIINCPMLKVLPPLPLSKLIITHCPNLKVLPPLPLHLAELEIQSVGLEDWKGWIQGTESGTCLSKFTMIDCPNLKVVPSLPLTLTQLTIRNVGLTTLPGLLCSCNRSKRSSFSALSELSIRNCSNLTSLDEGLLLHRDHLTALESLTIANCQKLVHFPVEILQHLPSLRHLTLEGCPKLPKYMGVAMEDFALSINCLETDCPSTLPLRSLTSLQSLRIGGNNELKSLPVEMEQWLLRNCATLRELGLGNLDSMQELPAIFQKLTSLKMLDLDGARQLQSMPDLPPTLERLIISRCNQALKERCLKDVGADWHKIAHIRDFKIL